MYNSQSLVYILFSLLLCEKNRPNYYYTNIKNKKATRKEIPRKHWMKNSHNTVITPRLTQEAPVHDHFPIHQNENTFSQLLDLLYINGTVAKYLPVPLTFFFCVFQSLIVALFVYYFHSQPCKLVTTSPEESATPVQWRESFTGILDYEVLFISQTGLGNKRGPAGPPRTRVLMC